MTVLEVTLIALAAMTGVALLFSPLVLLLKQEEVRLDVPSEIYDRDQPRAFGVKLAHVQSVDWTLWFLFWIFDLEKWKVPSEIAGVCAVGIIPVVLVSRLVWASRIVRGGEAVDARLQRHAKYELWTSAAGFVACSAIVVLLVFSDH